MSAGKFRNTLNFNGDVFAIPIGLEIDRSASSSVMKFGDAAVQCSFIEFGARQGSLEVRPLHYLDLISLRFIGIRRFVHCLFTLFYYPARRIWKGETEGFSVWHGSNNGSTTGVVIGSGPTGVGRVRYYDQEGWHLSFVTSAACDTYSEMLFPINELEAGAGAEAWVSCLRANAGTISLSSRTSDETAWVEEFVLSCNKLP
ncbi:hypothetical protein Tco_0691969 [Tanacetum coccineum]